jgi:very-short-patch-repair endonuclease
MNVPRGSLERLVSQVQREHTLKLKRPRKRTTSAPKENLADLLSFQLKAAKLEHQREVLLIPERKYSTDILIGKLAIECDGATWIGGRHARGYGIETDSEKQNLLVAQGYIPMRFTRKQIKEGRAMYWIERALVVTGHAGEL